jgi:hypothetical protein
MRPRSSFRSLLGPRRLTPEECAESCFCFLLNPLVDDAVTDSELDLLPFDEEGEADFDLDRDFVLDFDVFEMEKLGSVLSTSVSRYSPCGSTQSLTSST